MELSSIVVGRDRELEAVKMPFDSLLEGRWALAVVAGDTGIGKTTLVKKVLADLSLVNGTCVYGKFEQYYSDQPYLTLIQILEQTAGHILTLPEEKLKVIKRELRQKLGRDGALLSWLVPGTRGIVGEWEGIHVHDYQKLKMRLARAFQIFLAVAARELYPLVIAVDDLQWADEPSWEVVQSLYNSSHDHPFYLILVYKDDLEAYRGKVAAMLTALEGYRPGEEIRLDTLSSHDVADLLARVFEGRFDDFDGLVRSVYRKTAGNPLYIQQMLRLFVENKGIYYDYALAKWRLDREQAQVVNLPDKVADLISSKIANLQPATKKFLEVAACMGSSFTRTALGLVTGSGSDLLDEHLEILCRLGLIVENGECFEFFHNRIHQNAYEQIAPDRKKALHYRIAMALLQHPDPHYLDENLLPVTSHLLHCPELIKKEGTGQALLLPLYRAGLRAKQSAAVEHALKLFSLAEELLEETAWQSDYQGTFRLKLELAECRFICDRHEEAQTSFAELLAQAACPEDLAAVKKRYMTLNSYRGNPEQVIALGREALQCLGYNLPVKWLKFQLFKEIFQSSLLFRSSRLEALRDAPPVTDRRLTDALEILMIMAASANLLDEDLFGLIFLRIGNLSARYGNSPFASLGYVAYSMLVGNVFGDYAKGEKLQDLALGLAERFDEEQFKALAYFCIGSYVTHWTAPARESYAYLRQAFSYALRSGDYLYCCYALMIMLEMQHSMGVPLIELQELLELPERYPRELSNDLLRRAVLMFREHIELLTQEGNAPAGVSEQQETVPLQTNEVMIYHLLKIQRLYLEGQLEEAWRLLQTYIRHLDSIRGYINQVDWVFYYLLVSLEQTRNRKRKPWKSLKVVFHRYRRKLRRWADLCPPNHGAKYLLIEGLYREVRNRPHEALRRYEAAIELARENSNVFLQALGNCLAAACLRENPKLARVYAGEACRLFTKWGAGATADRLRRLYGIGPEAGASVTMAPATPDATENRTGKAGLSFADRLQGCERELETMELGYAYRYFLDVVCREAGADAGAILLERQDRLWLAYRWQKGGTAVACGEALDPEQVDFLPKRVLRYAGRTYETVVLSAKPEVGPFAGDDYIREREEISIICLPLKYNDIFVGLVYLESSFNHRLEEIPVESIRHLSLYLVAKEALTKDTKSQAVPESDLTVQLTEREKEVLCYMAQGMSNKEIGGRLNISSSTVKTHTLNLYGKLGVNSRVQAVTKAKELKLV